MTKHVIIELQLIQSKLVVKEVQPTRFGKLLINDEVLINEHNKSTLSLLMALAENSNVSKIEELHLKINGSLIRTDAMASGFSKNAITLLLYNVQNKLDDFLQHKTPPDLGILQHDLFMQIAETIDDVIWIRNDNEFLYVNSAFERVWGRKRETLLEDPLAMVQWVHPDDKVEMEPWVNLSQFQSQLTYVEQFRIIKPDGSSCWVWLRLYPLRNEEGEVDRVIGIASDINELKKFEEALLDAKEKAQESDKLKSIFLANISHEIRTPMNGIVGFAELITRTELNEKMRQSYVNLIKQSSEQLVRIIDDIIDISKIESNLIELKNIDFNLNKLISDTEILFQRSLNNARNSTLKLVVTKPMSDDDAMVKGDKMRIQQVLNNLINNAIKYTSDGSVEFGYQIEKDMVLFSVKDTGIGIPQNKQDVIFGHFRQVDEGHTRKFGGTGLGLSISKGLVNLMGGDIWFNSTKGEGSSFYFTIPYIRVKSKVGVSESTHNISGYNWEGKTILVAEDDKLNFEFIKAILTPTMATVVRASNGSQVIKLCNTVACDIILMDIRLPIYNGLEATKRIREKGITTPIIAQTAYAYEDDRKKCLAAGCDDYITKPLRKDLMLRKIDRFFEMKSE